MKKNILLKTYILVCAVILFGFAIIAVISYNSNKGIFKQDVERVTDLSSEGIHHQIDSIFNKPINISLTMANDNLLKTFLSQEKQRLNDKDFVQQMRGYLMAYKEKYHYDSVFLVSAKTNRYYHFNGIDRILKPDNPENAWYDSFLKTKEESALNIDNDEASNDEITIFINCKIRDTDGSTMGVVGVGFKVDSLQELLKKYEDEFDVNAFLADRSGNIEISTEQTGYEKTNLADNPRYSELKDKIVSNTNTKEKKSFWYSSKGIGGYLTVRYITNLDWFLIIDNDTSALTKQLNWQLLEGIVVIILVIGCVLFTITRIIRKYNTQIVQLTVAKEHEHQSMFQTATEQMYESIHELDITHNCTASESTEAYFESLGVPRNTPYDDALHMIARKQIKEEFRQGYIATFSTKNVIEAFAKGIESLRYDFMITNDGNSYYWVRITARIFRWEDDKSIRMFVYRQNVDSEKRQEEKMLEQLEKDSLSKLYNKAATQDHIQRNLRQNPNLLYAFFILDIDDFKGINDNYGHATGDLVIADFAERLRLQFRSGDIIGRIGGDEFAAFLPIPSREWVDKKAGSLVAALHYNFKDESRTVKVSVSIGIAIAPDAGWDFDPLYKRADTALYQTKEKGKDGYTIFSNPS